MAQMLGGSDGAMPGPVDYRDQGLPPRISGMAIASMVLGILAIPLTCFLVGIPLGIVALVLGIISLSKINREPQRFGGKGFAIAGIVTSIVGMVAVGPLLIAILLSSLGKARELGNRAACGANLRGIVMSVNAYGVDNADSFPILPYAPFGPSNAGTSGAALAARTVPDGVRELYASGGPQNGSPLAAMWIMVMRGDVAPKQLLCLSDTHVSGATSASVTAAGGNYFSNFQADNQISYSVAYPYASTGEPGRWWRAAFDANLPVMADMAPLDGTGTPARKVSTGAGKAANSGNHGGDGQNVAFADAHVIFTRSPVVGESGDNIYTMGGLGPSPTGTPPTKAPLAVDGSPGAWDTVMVPERNLDTGGLW